MYDYGIYEERSKNFIEYLSFTKTEAKIEYTLELHYRAWKEGHKIYQELRVGDVDDGISIDGKARELLKAVYLKPLRDAEREMSSGRGSRISQILLNHPVFKDKKEHAVLDIFRMPIDTLGIISQMIQMGNVFSRRSAVTWNHLMINASPVMRN